MAVWDEAPHVAALTFLPLVVLFTARWWLAAAISMALSVSANAFGATAVTITLACVLVAWAGSTPLSNTFRVAAAGALGWLLIAGWFPLSQLVSMRQAAELHGDGWSAGSWTALSLVVLVATCTWILCVRFRLSPWATFIALFASTMTAIPATHAWLNRVFLPQPGRYKMEAELGLALVLAFASFSLLRRLPLPLKVALCAVALSVAAEQTISHRKFEKLNVRSADMTRTIEARIANFFQQNMPSARVAVPGSIAQWLNNYSRQQQFAGSSWSTAYNPEQQRLNTAWQGATTPEEAARSIASLRDYGVQAYAVPGRNSPEFWKAVAKPELHSDCPLLWVEDETRICAIPQEGESMANPAASFRWLSDNEAQINGAVPAGAPVSVRVTWHPGWRAFSHDRELRISRDPLGLIAIEPLGAGPYEIRLVYDGGLELKLTRVLTYGTWIGVLLYALVKGWSRRLGREFHVWRTR